MGTGRSVGWFVPRASVGTTERFSFGPTQDSPSLQKASPAVGEPQAAQVKGMHPVTRIERFGCL